MSAQVAYFSMEIGISSKIPTYSGGLGVLAGDTLKTAADMSFPMVGVTLLASHGYFYQKIYKDDQIEEPTNWMVDDFLDIIPQKVEIEINNQKVVIGAWRYKITGSSGFEVPVYFLTTILPENNEHIQYYCHHLYGQGSQYRLAQEIILGIGGVRLLEEIGYSSLQTYHINEGHSALLTLELMDRVKDKEKVKRMTVFTTHTPVPAGHDVFSISDVLEYLPEHHTRYLPDDVHQEGLLNMTKLAFAYSNFHNGVSQSHRRVTADMFPGYTIAGITNGVHARTWVSDSFATLYSQHLPGWEQDPHPFPRPVNSSL